MKNHALLVISAMLIASSVMFSALTIATKWAENHPEAVACDNSCKDAQNYKMRMLMYPPGVPAAK